MSIIKVLLVDDMAIINELIISQLGELRDNFHFLKANNGREACKIAQSEKPNLIIMDWEMPVMNGIDALTLLKRNENTKDIPVIISSAFSDSDSVRTALEAGAIDYIRKPIDDIELIARVRSVLALTSTFEALKVQKEQLMKERQKIEMILKGILPSKIVEEIRETGTSKPRLYKNASVLFADLVNFTAKTNKMSPKRLIDELNVLFSALDHIITTNNCARIKTIGDAYLAVSGLPEEDPEHAEKLVKSAIEFRQFIDQRNQVSPIQWEIRIGIHSGNVIGSLVGYKNFLFDIFGDSVNTASRIQSQAEPMEICVSDSTYQLTHNKYNFSQKPLAILKGKGETPVFLLEQIENNGNAIDIPEEESSPLERIQDPQFLN